MAAAQHSAIRPARDIRYRELLLKYLAGRELKEILFFVNDARFSLLKQSIGGLLKRPDVSVLNVASGPFALEFYCSERRASVTSIDRDPALPALHRALCAEGLIENAAHVESDAMAYEPDRQFDLIVINDLFYTPGVDFGAVFEKYRHHLKPQGVLYFDILDERASLIWRAFNRDAPFRRYSMAKVRETLARSGFVIETDAPWFGIKGGPDRLARVLLWRLFGIANNVVFAARRKDPAAAPAKIGAAKSSADLEPLLS